MSAGGASPGGWPGPLSRRQAHLAHAQASLS